jgi:hypothetical protein
MFGTKGYPDHMWQKSLQEDFKAMAPVGARRIKDRE